MGWDVENVFQFFHVDPCSQKLILTGWNHYRKPSVSFLAYFLSVFILFACVLETEKEREVSFTHGPGLSRLACWPWAPLPAQTLLFSKLHFSSSFGTGPGFIVTLDYISPTHYSTNVHLKLIFSERENRVAKGRDLDHPWCAYILVIVFSVSVLPSSLSLEMPVPRRRVSSPHSVAPPLWAAGSVQVSWLQACCPLPCSGAPPVLYSGSLAVL